MFDIDVTPEPWMEDSKCANDVALREWQRENRNDQFFDDGSGKQGNTTTAEFRKKRAKKYCSDCPVASDCLAYALQNDLVGLFAGTSSRDRKTMKKKARKAALEFLERLQARQQDDSSPIAS